MKNTREIIKSQPFFKGLNDEIINILCTLAEEKKIKKDKFIFKVGETANCFYLINNGSVEIEIYSPERGAINIQTLGPGEILGWSWMFSPNKWHFDARTLEDSTFIEFDAGIFMKKCEENHELGYQVIKRFSLIMLERLQSTRFQLLDIYGKK